jgi:hypothetical protein
MDSRRFMTILFPWVSSETPKIIACPGGGRIWTANYKLTTESQASVGARRWQVPYD